jgi:hypothetical protein
MESISLKQHIVETKLDHYSCKIAGCNAITNSSKEMFFHLRKLHKTDEKFESRCLFSKECFHESNFKSFGGLERHIRTFHPIFLKSPVLEPTEEIQTFTEPDNGSNSAVRFGMHFQLGK